MRSLWEACETAAQKTFRSVSEWMFLSPCRVPGTVLGREEHTWQDNKLSICPRRAGKQRVTTAKCQSEFHEVGSTERAGATWQGSNLVWIGKTLIVFPAPAASVAPQPVVIVLWADTAQSTDESGCALSGTLSFGGWRTATRKRAKKPTQVCFEFLCSGTVYLVKGHVFTC